jgi:sarcosine oxidase subunit gamma
VAEPLLERPALEGLARPAAGGGVRCHERQGLCLTQVIARPGQAEATARALGLTLPEPPNTTRSEGEIVVFCLRPLDWLIVSLDDDGRRGGTAQEARRRLAGLAAAIDQSHGRVALRLAGAGSRAVLQHAIAVDLAADRFGKGGMAQTAINGIAVLLHAVGDDVFDLFVARSYAPDLLRRLGHAGVELAGTTEG